MSVFFCDSCDNLVDSDEIPEFEHNESTNQWICGICLDIKAEEERKLKDDWDKFDLYHDPVLNWSGLR